ncbi:hypothetical protein Tco_0058313 [Tanacetum coccineum]
MGKRVPDKNCCIRVNLFHDGVFTVRPFEYAVSDVKQITDIQFEEHSGYDALDMRDQGETMADDGNKPSDAYWSSDEEDLSYVDFHTEVDDNVVVTPPKSSRSGKVPKESGAKWRLPAEEGQYTRTSHVGSGLVLAKTRCKATLVERGKAAEWTVELKQMDMVLSSKMPMPHIYAELKNNRFTNYTFNFDQMRNEDIKWTMGYVLEQLANFPLAQLPQEFLEKKDYQLLCFYRMRRIRMCAEVEQGSGRLVALEDGDLG